MTAAPASATPDASGKASKSDSIARMGNNDQRVERLPSRRFCVEPTRDEPNRDVFKACPDGHLCDGATRGGAKIADSCRHGETATCPERCPRRRFADGPCWQLRGQTGLAAIDMCSLATTRAGEPPGVRATRNRDPSTRGCAGGGAGQSLPLPGCGHLSRPAFSMRPRSLDRP